MEEVQEDARYLHLQVQADAEGRARMPGLLEAEITRLKCELALMIAQLPATTTAAQPLLLATTIPPPPPVTITLPPTSTTMPPSRPASTTAPSSIFTPLPPPTTPTLFTPPLPSTTAITTIPLSIISSTVPAITDATTTTSPITATTSPITASSPPQLATVTLPPTDTTPSATATKPSPTAVTTTVITSQTTTSTTQPPQKTSATTATSETENKSLLSLVTTALPSTGTLAITTETKISGEPTTVTVPSVSTGDPTGEVTTVETSTATVSSLAKTSQTDTGATAKSTAATIPVAAPLGNREITVISGENTSIKTTVAPMKTSETAQIVHEIKTVLTVQEEVPEMPILLTKASGMTAAEIKEKTAMESIKKNTDVPVKGEKLSIRFAETWKPIVAPLATTKPTVTLSDVQEKLVSSVEIAERVAKAAKIARTVIPVHTASIKLSAEASAVSVEASAPPSAEASVAPVKASERPAETSSPQAGREAQAAANQMELITTGEQITYVTIDDYTWSQSARDVIVYVNIPELKLKDKKKISWFFDDRQAMLNVDNLAGKSYNLFLQNLEHKIKPKKSHWKINDGGIMLRMFKDNWGMEWQQLIIPKETENAEHTFNAKTTETNTPHFNRSQGARPKIAEVNSSHFKDSQNFSNEYRWEKSPNSTDTSMKQPRDSWKVNSSYREGNRFNKNRMNFNHKDNRNAPKFNTDRKVIFSDNNASRVTGHGRKNMPQHTNIQNSSEIAWIIEDAQTASVAVESFVSAPPRLVKLAFPPTQSVSMKLVTAVAKTPCDLTLMLKDSFQHPTKQNFIRDGAFLHILVTNSRCRLVTFYGHLSEKDVAKLPACTSRLGLSIGCAADLSALAKLAHLTDLNTLSLMIDTSVDAKKLQPIPVIEVKKLFLCFNNVTNGNINDVASALKLLQQRVRAVVFTNSSVTEKGVLLFGHELKANPPVTATVVIHSSSVTATSVPKLVAQYLLLGLTLLIEAN